MSNTPALIAFSLFTCEGEYATWDTAHGVGHSDYQSHIYTIASDGVGLRKVIGDQVGANNPRFSPDGRWLYFQAKVNDSYQIFRAKPDGSGVQNLTATHTMSKDSFGFDFAPDGRLVYVSNNGIIGHVAVMNADGSGPRLLVPELGYCYMASFSPNGKRIAFAHTERGYVLAAADTDGKNLVTLTPDLPESFAPRYTADGKMIIFLRRDEDLYSVGADGSNPRRLTMGNKYLHFFLSPSDKHGSTDGFSVSPNGKRVAYIAMKDGLSQLHVMNIDGSGQRQVTRMANRCGRPRWSGDGCRVGFVSFVREGQSQLFSVDVDQDEPPRQLTDLPGAVYLFDWAPA